MIRVFALLLCLGGCAPSPDAPPSGDRVAVAGTNSASPAPSPVHPAASSPDDPAVSLYDLRLDLTNAEGATVGVDVGRGHPTLVSMFYTTCPAACPILIATIQAIEAAVSPEVRQELRVVLN